MFNLTPATQEEHDSLVEKRQKNGWLKRGGFDWQDDPWLEECPYDFSRASTIKGLAVFFSNGNRTIRQGVLFGDFAFIQQVDGGDEWWTLKRCPDGSWMDFESYSMSCILPDMSRFTQVIASMQLATPDECNESIWGLQDAVGLTRSMIKRILEGCNRFDEFAIDPATLLIQVAAKIDRAKLEVFSNGIKYTKLPENDWYTMEVLEVEDLTAYLDQNAYEPKHSKSIYNYVVYDSSTVERPFAYDLDMAEDVKVFAKLPSRFTIDTPVGSYNPDWAYATEGGYGGKRVFFVVKTKGGGNVDLAMRPREAAKIDCARKHFAALDDGVTYSVRTTYAATSA